MEQITKLMDNFELTLVFKTLAYLLVLLIMYKTITIISNRVIKKGKDFAGKTTIVKTVDSILKTTALVAMIILFLEEFGIETKEIIASLGIIGLFLAIGLQGLIKDTINSLFILTERQYKVGDTIEVSGFKGEVVKVNLKTTKLVKWNGEICYVRNGEVNRVINHSQKNIKHVFSVFIDASSSIEKVTSLLDEDESKWCDKYEILNEDIYLGIGSMTVDGIELKFMIETTMLKHYSIERLIKKELLEIFNKNNIDLPIRSKQKKTSE